MSNAIIGNLLDTVPDPMVMLDKVGTIIACNLPARALLGEWVQGRNYVTALRQPALLSRIEAAYAEGVDCEARFVQTDQAGETIFRVTIRPVTRAMIGYDGVLLHFQDITHLREAEEMRRDFVANVSHELRTPLTAIMGFIETLKGPAREDIAAQDRFLGIMEDEARRMNRMIQDLLSLSRVEGQERMRPQETVNLTDVLSGVIESLRKGAEKTGTVLRIEGADAPLLVTGDSDQLTQVFLNLAENAIKYGGEGRPVLLRASEGEGTGNLKGPIARVDVIDKGEGIDPLHLPRLTERFYRIDTHRSRAMGGTGLGLAIVKHIVNRHRGRLRISSEPGQGSCFSVILPKA
ncbi:two-component sensor histidine kinase [Rhodophyticola sp. CCM32]|uniref:ATP-binding protein n=1 Tax=Rhodophyticola sp. CCM32 TaxID=2916397 RepID=UPI00107F3B3F|nr:ATP-binding protein [Rhodophyticola sp. CCM32]QBY00602.1 two-component sensor histidine kinase [Rhodophyticola sp. CCM32]